MKIGILGAGPFPNHFIPLFQAHPLVEEVVIAERMAERRDAACKKHGIKRAFDNFDDLLASDVDAIGVYTQRWTHAPWAIKAMRAGKHVFSAVPAAISLEELEELIDTVKETGQLYMLGETTWYEAPTILARKLNRIGAFGDLVYGEANYCHDMEHGFYPPYQIANGDEWKQFASFPPMLYPTHSVGQIVGVTGQPMQKVSCFGQTDNHEDAIFDSELSYFDNAFSNETGLFQASGGASYRANEFRRVSGVAPLIVQGTKGALIDRLWMRHDRTNCDFTEQLIIKPQALPEDWAEQKAQGAQDDFLGGVSATHDFERLPPTFNGLSNGHGGSHHFLADDFVHMVSREQTPVLNVWTAARMCAPGIIAHQSALKGGELMSIPDFGPAPADLTIMDIEQEAGKDVIFPDLVAV